MNIKSVTKSEYEINTLPSHIPANGVFDSKETHAVNQFQNPFQNNENGKLENYGDVERFFSLVAKPVSVTSQTSIYLEGNSAQSIYFVNSGMVKLISYMPNGRARIVRILGKGGILGLEGLLHEEMYKHTAVSVGGVKLSRVAVARFRGLMQHDSELTAKIIEHWHNHLFFADTWITQFSAGAIKSRVARLVNFLGAIEYGSDSTCVRLLTCEEMAEVLGVTPESVSRVLAQFKRDGLLASIQERPFEVYQRDPSRLQTIAGL